LDGGPGVRFAAPDGKIFFIADNGVHGRELWVTDGTPAGTLMVKDIQPGPLYSNFEFKPEMGALIGSRLVFTAEELTHGREAWVTDGTPNGTFLLKDILPGSGTSGASYFKAWNGRVWINGDELWVTDGTPAGTVLAKDLNPGPCSSSPRFCHEAQGRLYFRAGTRDTAREHLWQLMMAPVPSFAEWAAAASLPAGQSGALDHPSGDGVPNLLKYAFNLNPALPDRTEWTPGHTKGLPSVTREVRNGQPRLSLRWLQRRGAAITCTPLLSNNLETWSLVTAPVEVTHLDDYWSIFTVSAGIPQGSEARYYGAVRVSMD
jgi:ELWxxDGT repeat protein